MIQVDSITKSYGATRALKGVTFTINKGEIVGFLGPNGAGKTTAMKILTCYMPADSGSVNVDGYDVFDNSIDVRKRIGYMPENTPLYHEMPVIDFLRFVGGMRGISGDRLRQRIKKLVAVTGLQGAVTKTIGELSKGYRQRVGLAQALIHEPDILVLDEPTSGLDPNQIAEIRDLIREIGREKTVILSTHILPEVTATCDRAIIISDGKVVASGTPQDLVSRSGSGNSVVVQVRGPEADVEKRLREVNGVTDVKVLGRDGGLVRLELHGGDAPKLAEAVFGVAVANKWTLSELRQESASLEQVFAELTK